MMNQDDIGSKADWVKSEVKGFAMLTVLDLRTITQVVLQPLKVYVKGWARRIAM